MIKQAGKQYYHSIELKNEGRYDEARLELEAVIAADPEHADACWQLGLIYGYMGLFELSVAQLIAAARLNLSNLSVHNDLGLTYSMLGMCEKARAEFEYVLSVDPENEIARKNIDYFC